MSNSYSKLWMLGLSVTEEVRLQRKPQLISRTWWDSVISSGSGKISKLNPSIDILCVLRGCYRRLDTPSFNKSQRLCKSDLKQCNAFTLQPKLKSKHTCACTQAWIQTYDTLDYDHGVGCIISCNQWIHNFSQLPSMAILKTHLTVYTFRFPVYIQRSFQSILARWLKWSCCLSITTDGRSSIHVCTPVCICKCVHEKQMLIVCCSHAYTYCTWHRIMITQVCVHQ